MNASTGDNEVDRPETELRRAIVDALDPQNMERRTSERYAYSTVQRAAPCREAGTPEESAFQQVLCRDISRGGLSFFWPQEPDFQHVMIGLSAGPGSVCLRARVLRCLPVTDPQNGFLVCCQFVKRME